MSLLFFIARDEALAYTGFFSGGGSKNSVEDRGNGDLATIAPSQGFWRQL
jgi:hypothetical protein